MEDGLFDNCETIEQNKTRSLTNRISTVSRAVKYSQMTNHRHVSPRLKLVILFGLGTVILLLLFIGSVIYASLETDEIFDELKPQPAADLPEMEMEEEEEDDEDAIFNIIAQIWSSQQPNKNLYNVIADETKYRRRRSSEDERLNEIETDERASDKRDIELMNRKNLCHERYEKCRKVLDDMNTLTRTASNNLDALKKLLSPNQSPDNSPFAEFLQCVECDNLSTVKEAPQPRTHPQPRSPQVGSTYLNTQQNSDATVKMYVNGQSVGDSAVLESTLNPNVRTYFRHESAPQQLPGTPVKVFLGDQPVSAPPPSVASSQPIDGSSPVFSIYPHSQQTQNPNVQAYLNYQPPTQITTYSFVPPVLPVSTEAPQHAPIKVVLNGQDVPIPTSVVSQPVDGSPMPVVKTIETADGSTKTVFVQKSNSSQVVDGTEVTSYCKNTTIVEKSSAPTQAAETVETISQNAPVKFNFLTVQQTESTQSPPMTTARTEGAFRNYQNANLMQGPQQFPQVANYETNPPIIPTAETMKTGQQVQITPPMGFGNVPVCFFGTPPPISMNIKQTSPNFPPYSQYSYPSGPSQRPGFSSPGQGFSSYQSSSAQAGPYGAFQANSMGGYPGWIAPTGPGQSFQGFNARGQAYYCTYMPASTFPFPAPLQPDFHRTAETPPERYGNQVFVVPTENGWISNNAVYPGYQLQCQPDEHQCLDGSLCISREKWCDGTVHCPDASDETRCSCRNRINRDRLCDGYFDCPRGEDELGCFGCPPNFFSCQDWNRRHMQDNCVPFEQRCDGVRQCANGKDEMECTMLTQSMAENDNAFTTGYLTGYLYKNHQGKWYPVCTGSSSWVMDACMAETGTRITEMPKSEAKVVPQGMNYGPYIALRPKGEIQIVPNCGNQALYVKCPPIPCGTRVPSGNSYRPYGFYEDSLVASQLHGNSSGVNNTGNRNQRDVNGTELATIDVKRNIYPKLAMDEMSGDSRVVGGRASQPQAWPFLVAIYKDGVYNCGGVIVDEHWVLTAAHCVDGYQNHYYEVQAGLLRRFSFSPMAQSRRASYIIVHPQYDRSTMQNDIALIKLNEPLRFNRWIRHTCLPQNSWNKEPTPQTTCITIGWGATVEHGPDPDHLREVEVPILAECKHIQDRHDGEICAGVPQGGRDACQGDSGGPLMCEMPRQEGQWYVAGIVSHGEGCGRENEPGAYTRVSKYNDWIRQVIHATPSAGKVFTQCPGFTCGGGTGKCIPNSRRCNGIVDCLDAEDEMNCPPATFQGRQSEQATQRPDYPMPKAAIIDAFGDYDVTSPAPPAPSPEIIHETTEPTTTTPPPTTLPPIPKGPPQFACTRVYQNISISRRCDGIVDCEDGTDEENCSCRDILLNTQPYAICDGHVHCYDRSDEDNCTFCGDNQFTCSRSGACIPMRMKCDKIVHCPLKEDEADCYILSNGQYVIHDLDDRPHLNLEGVVTNMVNGDWRPSCINNNETVKSQIAENMCHYLGLKGHAEKKTVAVDKAPLETRRSTGHHVIPYEYDRAVRPANGSNTCEGLWVKCQTVLSSSVESHRVEHAKADPRNTSYLWPWEAAIFVDGRYHCPAVLLENEWLMASDRCARDINLGTNYTTAVLGLSPTFKYADGPHQQTTNIDSVRHVDRADAAVLHLVPPVNMTRHVQPVFLEKNIFPQSTADECVALGTDANFNSAMTFLQSAPEGCPNCHRCYKNATYNECRNNETANWDGIVVCRGPGGWYPAAIFSKKDMLCGFQTPQILTSIDYVNAHLSAAMEERPELIAGPYCDGVQCSVGNCVPWSRVCDGIMDCRDGRDESVHYCSKKKELCEQSSGLGCSTCSKSELRCKSGKCVPKEKFCDRHIDCDDGSDEPANCTCASYLRLTDPNLVCDNRRHCQDKTDETAEGCMCKDSSFQCDNSTRTTQCVPRDFVCDGEPDCSNGADENNCRMIKGHHNDPRNVGQVLKRTLGVWHSECFPLPVESTEDARKICRSMHYADGVPLTPNNASKYDAALEPIIDNFYTVRLNDYKWLNMRNDKPIVTLKPPKGVCHRAFVKCI